jgi:hypothetical protein
MLRFTSESGLSPPSQNVRFGPKADIREMTYAVREKVGRAFIKAVDMQFVEEGVCCRPARACAGSTRMPALGQKQTSHAQLKTK